MNSSILKILYERKEHIIYYNRMAPFPVFGTDYVEYITNKIKEMEESEIDYDALPVVACKYCNNLHILNDEVENDICSRCGSINELIIYKDIFSYLKSQDDE